MYFFFEGGVEGWCAGLRFLGFDFFRVVLRSLGFLRFRVLRCWVLGTGFWILMEFQT